MFDSSWINNEIGVKGHLVTAEVRGLLDKQFTEGFSSYARKRLKQTHFIKYFQKNTAEHRTFDLINWIYGYIYVRV